ncbi:MAG: hypothetical protein HKN13_07075, partial [Rhodothermales bacterium]|nr:hypothetical protein [Rhodothermales bacterium]
MKRFLSLSLLVVFFVSATGCDNSNTEDDPPAVIAPDLFQIDTSFFSTPASKSNPKLHFANGALRVWPVSLIVSASMILPAAVTGAALQDEPIFTDGAWRWESTASFNANTLTFGLVATPDGNGHNW